MFIQCKNIKFSYCVSNFFILNFLVYFEIVAFHIDEGQAGVHAFM